VGGGGEVGEWAQMGLREEDGRGGGELW
jgi:hypothetical protein